MTSWLQKQRKGDLQSLADQAGLKHDIKLKDDLVAALDQHLRDNSTTLSGDKKFAEYYTRGASPVKKGRPSASADPSGEPAAKPQRRRTISVKKDPESPGAETSGATGPTSPSSVQTLASRIRLPASPRAAEISQEINAQTARLNSKARSAWKKLAIKKRAAKASQRLSDVWTIQGLIWVLELTGLTYGTLPWTWRFETPDFKPLGLHSQAVWLPQVFNLLTSKFWAPAAVWLATSLVVPAFFAYFFNLTYTNPKPKNKRVKPLREYDPLTFSIIKGLTTYLVYSQGFRFWGLFADSTITVVNESVFGGYNGILIGAVIGVLTSMHDHLSFKS